MLTKSSLTAKVDGYKLIEGEYLAIEAQFRATLQVLQTEMDLFRQSREYIAVIRQQLENELSME